MTTESIPLKKRPTTQKAKGNKYERDTAKKLSVWMFNDPTVLYRHEDSGARKVVYSGDIIPKSMSKFTWSIFPFVIECKNGYQNNIPTLMNQNHLRLWLNKLLNERTDEQRIPIFIAQYHHQVPILLTTILLRHNYQLALMTENCEFFYIYRFNDLLKFDFISIMPDWFPSVVEYNKPLTIIKETPIIKETTQPIIEKAIDTTIKKEKPKDVKKQEPDDIEEKPLTKKEQNEIMGEIIVDMLSGII